MTDEQMRELLSEIREKLMRIHITGHNNDYDWNADPANLTRLEGEVIGAISAGLKKVGAE